jgi:hypothetical protein
MKTINIPELSWNQGGALKTWHGWRRQKEAPQSRISIETSTCQTTDQYPHPGRLKIKEWIPALQARTPFETALECYLKSIGRRERNPPFPESYSNLEGALATTFLQDAPKGRRSLPTPVASKTR